MKINIVGGGPAGLYFGILMKKIDPDHQISIFERDGPNDTYGWGIVFSDKTLSYLEPLPLAYELMTRSTKIDHEKLSKRDPEFIAEYDRWRSGE